MKSKTYELSFTGRKVRAIGILSDFTIQVRATTIEADWLKLYDTHEHITRKHWRIVPNQRQIAKTKNLLRSI